ncbi:MAG: peptidylprolyl isomerase [Candidatus Aminicenantes bacterium]|nr:MAG: peptidylprolyl isomerase [Candidatus Aminicenantes bacterium]
MKRYIIFVLLPALVLLGCSKEQKEVKMEQGTPGYQLAKDLVPILPMLDPEVNAVLIRTNTFTVTTGEIIQTLYSNMGKRTEQLKTFDAERLRSIIDENAKRLAERKLLLAAANKAKSSVTQEEIDNILDLQYRRSGGEEKFLQFLEENGIDVAIVKTSIEKDLLIENYLNGYFMEKIPVSEEEVQKIYGEDKTASVRHILLSTQNKTDTEKQTIRKKMEEILSRAKSGEDFAELAKTYTEDPGSKDNGGLYENFGRGKMVPPFEEAAFSVPVGEISDIVETTFGYHIIKVIERTKETRPLDEVRTEIETNVRQKQQNKVYQELLGQLKEKASLQIIQY